MSAPPRATPPDPSGAVARPQAPEYEFEDAAKESFRALAASVSFVGVCALLFGVLAALFSVGLLYAGLVPSAIATAAGAVLSLVPAWWMVSAGRALSALVRTRGRDIQDLLEAVVEFRRLFGLARVVIVVISLAAVVGGSFAVWCTFLADRGGRCFLPWG